MSCGSSLVAGYNLLRLPRFFGELFLLRSTPFQTLPCLLHLPVFCISTPQLAMFSLSVLSPHRPSASCLHCRVPSRWIFSKSLIGRVHFFRAYKHSCRPQSGPLVVGLGQMSEDDGPGAVPLMSEQANFRQQLGHEDKTFLISTYCSRLKFRIGG